MAMDMDMVWATMDMDIDMVVMDMQLTGHMVMDIMERGLLMPNQQLSQQQMLMLMLMPGILPMAMDMAMVWATMDMDIDTVVMDMQLTGHMDMDIMESSSSNSYTCKIFIRRLSFDFYQFYQSISLLDQPCFMREMSLNIRVVGLLLLFVLIFFQ